MGVWCHFGIFGFSHSPCVSEFEVKSWRKLIQTRFYKGKLFEKDVCLKIDVCKGRGVW